MPTRAAVCKIIGDGLTSETAYRAKVADSGISYAAVIKSEDAGPNRGHPVFAWALVLVTGTAAQLNTLDADPDITIIGIDIDRPFGALTQARQDRFTAALAARGIDAGQITPATTVRELVERIGRHHVPGFSLAAMAAG